MYAVATHPQTIGKTLDGGFKLFFAGFKKVFFLAVMAAVVLALPAIFVGPMPQGAGPEVMEHIKKLMIFSIPAGLVYAVLSLAILRCLALASTNKKVADQGMVNAMIFGVKYLLPMIAASILYALAVGLGSVALIIPGIWLAVSLFLFTPAIAVEELGPIEALKRSFNLVKGNWWRTVTVMTVVMLVLMVVYFAVTMLAGVAWAVALSQGQGAVTGPDALAKMNFWIQMIQLPVNALLIPLFPAVSIVLFLDLKLRKEGGDLDSRLGKS